jgi:hypothetical protein
MNMIFGLARFNKSSASRFKSVSVFALIFTAVFFSSGCNKSQPAAQTPAPPAADTNQTSAAAPAAPVASEYASAPSMIAVSPNGGADLKQLNHAYVGWIIRNGRHPKSFEEFVASSGISVPPPPAGKKYIIDKNSFINFANN